MAKYTYRPSCDGAKESAALKQLAMMVYDAAMTVSEHRLRQNVDDLAHRLSVRALAVEQCESEERAAHDWQDCHRESRIRDAQHDLQIARVKFYEVEAMLEAARGALIDRGLDN